MWICIIHNHVNCIKSGKILSVLSEEVYLLLRIPMLWDMSSFLITRHVTILILQTFQTSSDPCLSPVKVVCKKKIEQLPPEFKALLKFEHDDNNEEYFVQRRWIKTD